MKKQSYFRLKPHVVMVDGAHRSALYNLYNQKILSIHKSQSLLIHACLSATIEDVLNSIGDSSSKIIAKENLEELDSLGFGDIHTNLPNTLPCITDPSKFLTKRLAFLSIDIRTSSSEMDWKSILDTAKHEFLCAQICIFISGDPLSQQRELAVLEVARELHFHQTEIVFDASSISPFWEEWVGKNGVRIALTSAPDVRNDQIIRMQGNGIQVRVSPLDSTPPRITPRMFKCDLMTFTRLKAGSVHNNHLHISSNGNAYLWMLETDHCLGKVTGIEDLKNLINSSELSIAWRLSKDRIRKCSICEFRYACENSYTYRSVPSEIDSPPGNCSYSPSEGVWH